MFVSYHYLHVLAIARSVQTNFFGQLIRDPPGRKHNMTEEGRNREWLLHSGGLMVGLSHRDGGENIHISWPFLNFNVLKWFVAVILHLRQR